MLLDNTLQLNVFDYEYEIEYSSDWYKLANGKWKASDRGSDYDHYLFTIETHGKDDYIQELLTYIQSANVISLTDINGPIIGANVDYTQPILAAVDGFELVEQTAYNAFDLKIKFRFVEGTFTDHTSTFPELKALQNGYKTGAVYTNQVVQAYNPSTINYQIINNTNGMFEGVFVFDYDDFAQLLHFAKTNRSLQFDMPTIPGVDYPFGRLNGNSNLKGKLKDLSNITQLSPVLFSVQITIVQD